MDVGNFPLTSNVKCLSLSYIRTNVVVCDRGDTDSNAIKNTSSINGIHCLRIREVDLCYQIRLTHP